MIEFTSEKFAVEFQMYVIWTLDRCMCTECVEFWATMQMGYLSFVFLFVNTDVHVPSAKDVQNLNNFFHVLGQKSNMRTVLL